MGKATRRAAPAFGNSMAPAQRATSAEEDAPPPVSDARVGILAAMQQMARGGDGPTAESLESWRASFRRAREDGELPDLPLPRECKQDVVYYFRVGNRIKIGYTSDIRQRAKYLAPEEILGWEPGGAELERRRHQQFHVYRTAHEWFVDCPAIRAHIDSLGSAG